MAENAASGTSTNHQRRCRRASHSAGRSVGASHRMTLPRYHHGGCVLARDAKSGARRVSFAKRVTLLNGAPYVIQSYDPTIVTIDIAAPASNGVRRRASSSSGTRKTISLKRSAKASPASSPAANGQRSTMTAAATTQKAASVRG